MPLLCPPGHPQGGAQLPVHLLQAESHPGCRGPEVALLGHGKTGKVLRLWWHESVWGWGPRLHQNVGCAEALPVLPRRLCLF